MTKRVLAIGCVVVTPFLAAITADSASPQTSQTGLRPEPRLAGALRAPAAQPAASAAPAASPQRALLDRYCVGCHSQRARAAGQEAARKLTLDDLDVARVADHPDVWERVVRKLRAGMMPPASARRPDKATYNTFITWLETELARAAVPYAPPPGLHRLK